MRNPSQCISIHSQYAGFKIIHCSKYIRALSWENLFLPYANNKGADQPAHLRSLISAFVIRWLDSIIPLVSISKISSLSLVSVAEEASLNLTWSQNPKTGFLVTRLIKERLTFFHRQQCNASSVYRPVIWAATWQNQQNDCVPSPVWSESSLYAWRKLVSLATHQAHSEDSDQTGRMPRLIWVFAGRTVILLVLSGGCSIFRSTKA